MNKIKREKYDFGVRNKFDRFIVVFMGIFNIAIVSFAIFLSFKIKKENELHYEYIENQTMFAQEIIKNEPNTQECTLKVGEKLSFENHFENYYVQYEISVDGSNHSVLSNIIKPNETFDFNTNSLTCGLHTLNYKIYVYDKSNLSKALEVMEEVANKRIFLTLS